MRRNNVSSDPVSDLSDPVIDGKIVFSSKNCVVSKKEVLQSDQGFRNSSTPSLYKRTTEQRCMTHVWFMS